VPIGIFFSFRKSDGKTKSGLAVQKKRREKEKKPKKAKDPPQCDLARMLCHIFGKKARNGHFLEDIAWLKRAYSRAVGSPWRMSSRHEASPWNVPETKCFSSPYHAGE
jgi:hypothetical protein